MPRQILLHAAISTKSAIHIEHIHIWIGFGCNPDRRCRVVFGRCASDISTSHQSCIALYPNRYRGWKKPFIDLKRFLSDGASHQTRVVPAVGRSKRSRSIALPGTRFCHLNLVDHLRISADSVSLISDCNRASLSSIGIPDRARQAPDYIPSMRWASCDIRIRRITTGISLPGTENHYQH